MSVDRDDLLGLGVALLPDAQLQRSAQDVGRRVRAALVLGHREPRRVPGFRERAGVVVDRQPQVVAERGAGNALRLVLVEQARSSPRSGRICACGRAPPYRQHAAQQRGRQRSCVSRSSQPLIDGVDEHGCGPRSRASRRSGFRNPGSAARPSPDPGVMPFLIIACTRSRTMVTMSRYSTTSNSSQMRPRPGTMRVPPSVCMLRDRQVDDAVQALDHAVDVPAGGAVDHREGRRAEQSRRWRSRRSSGRTPGCRRRCAPSARAPAARPRR